MSTDAILVDNSVINFAKSILCSWLRFYLCVFNAKSFGIDIANSNVVIILGTIISCSKMNCNFVNIGGAIA